MVDRAANLLWLQLPKYILQTLHYLQVTPTKYPLQVRQVQYLEEELWMCLLGHPFYDADEIFEGEREGSLTRGIDKPQLEVDCAGLQLVSRYVAELLHQ